MAIPYDLKATCVEAHKNRSSREVYHEVFLPEHDGMSYESFRRELCRWKKKQMADADTMCAGTYGGFAAHDATVQVDGNGNIRQAWIKQKHDDGQWEELLEVVRENTKPVEISYLQNIPSLSMLEIPLFDQHFPLSDHTETLKTILEIINSKRWDEINVVIGQDMLHNDDFMGRTSSGRQIEKVKIADGWKTAKDFYYNLIVNAQKQANRVNVIYSKGNHDESLSWAFVEMLKEMFVGCNFDNSLKQRKLIYWKGCFIGVTHGANKKSNFNDLRGQFTVEHPIEFAQSKVREIHTGHLHHEIGSTDLYGVNVRRLSTAAETDEWSDDEGYVGAHKRFTIFEYEPNRLKAIYYV